MAFATARVRFVRLFCLQTLSLLLVAAHCLAAGPRPSTSDTLALIGSKVISAGYFARHFHEKLARLGLTDNAEMRRGYLGNLVDDEVLIAEARRRGYDLTPAAGAELERLQTQELLNAFSEAHIIPAVQVTDEDLWTLFVRLNTRIKVRHLYAATHDGAASLHAELSRGKSFEELARRIFDDPQLRESGGLLGYITVDEMDPRFEAAAYALGIGEISRPVKTVQGYSIIRVDDIQGNPFLTQSEFLKAKERLRTYARRRGNEMAHVQYSAAARSSMALQFDPQLTERLFQSVRQQKVQHAAEPPRAISGRDLTRPIVKSASMSWDVRLVLDALAGLPETQLKWIRSRENLEDVIAGLIIREDIVRRAKAEGMHSTPGYREKVAYAFDTYLLTVLEETLKGDLRIPEDSVRSYYERNRDRFMTPAEIRISGILLEDSSRADSIRRMLEQGEPFERLAGRYSIQKATAARGGDMGFFRREQLGDIGELQALEEGGWTGPIRRDGKFLLVKCTGIRRPAQRSLEESSAEIRTALLAMAWDAARARNVELFKQSHGCRVFPERLMSMSIH
jgi:parvulin-like peptidyl-prolyl isomerase